MKTLFLYLFIFFSILHHQTIIFENQAILQFFLYQLLPSLFLLCVLIQLIPLPKIKNHFIPILNLDIKTLFIILKMILLGIPTSAYLVNQLVKENQLNHQQAFRLVSCISIPSISFMWMTIPFLYSFSVATKLFIIHIFSSFLLLLLTSHTKISLSIDIKEKKLWDALLFALKSMALILAYLFIMVSLKSLLLIYFPKFSILIHGLMEFSSGTQYFLTYPQPLFYLLISIGFNGFCAHLQVINGCDALNIKYPSYLLFRILHVVFNLCIYIIYVVFL